MNPRTQIVLEIQPDHSTVSSDFFHSCLHFGAFCLVAFCGIRQLSFCAISFCVCLCVFLVKKVLKEPTFSKDVSSKMTGLSPSGHIKMTI